eukprot:symbB.v1.2.016924.t2/scaffold1304.1/size242089/18
MAFCDQPGGLTPLVRGQLLRYAFHPLCPVDGHLGKRTLPRRFGDCQSLAGSTYLQRHPAVPTGTWWSQGLCNLRGQGLGGRAPLSHFSRTQPPEAKPTLCFVGLGRASFDMYVALHQLFPDLRILLVDVEEVAYLVLAAKELEVDVDSLVTVSIDDFAEGRERCNAIHWSLDAPGFSFFKYRDLFYSTPYIMALFNLQGCNPPWRLDGFPVDRYYCEYLYQSFKSTICGKVDQNNFAEYMGQDLYFPMVDAGCGENICLCHAHSDAYLDFHLELLCRNKDHKQFMGQWGQDEFLVQNVFGTNGLKGQGIYVDVGSSHPYHLSNTAYLDSCLNWRGVCMEPNPRLKHIIRGVRTCAVVDACAWANKTTMKFSNGLELAARTESVELKPSTPGEIEEDTHPAETFFEAPPN